jgi:branched-chain amino acid transport system substrate-binding protein
MERTLMLRTTTRRLIAFALAFTSSVAISAERKYGPGVSDTEIKIGQTIPYSGPAASFGTEGRVIAAYYRMINEQGGVNGRKINFLSLDDGYSPPKTVELIRRMVEQDEVLGLFGTVGTAPNAAVQKYLNDRKVPQLFLFSGAARFRDPQAFPWTMGGDLAFVNETMAFAEYILQAQPAPRIAVLYQNDDYGKDHLTGLRLGLGAEASGAIVKTASFELTDATVDSQIIDLQQSGANVVLLAALPKAAAQAIRKMHDIGWNPLKLLPFPASGISTTLKPAGLEASIGIVTAEFMKQVGDPARANDPEMLAFLTFMKKYAPDIDPNDKVSEFGYYHAAMVVDLLKRCGDNLTRENLLEQATHLKNVRIPMLLEGILINTAPDDYSPVKQMQLQRFDGTSWVAFGGIVGG